MRSRRLLSALAFGLALLGAGRVASEAQACGIEGVACEVPLGSYRIVMPQSEAPEAGYPALLFFHGAGGSGARTLGNTAMVDAFRLRGWAVIAPDGLMRPNSNFGPGWSFLPSRPAQRDELAFAREILADAANRHRIDRASVLMSGFSIGGSLAWYLACQDPSVVAAFAPVAGAFWRPHPEVGACAGPVRLLHTHGWRDQTVPLEGRPLRSADILQGDVFHGLLILRDANGCEGLRADQYDTDGPFWQRWWTRCTEGSALELALHTGGHVVPEGWAELALKWYERTMREQP